MEWVWHRVVVAAAALVLLAPGQATAGPPDPIRWAAELHAEALVDRHHGQPAKAAAKWGRAAELLRQAIEVAPVDERPRLVARRAAVLAALVSLGVPVEDDPPRLTRSEDRASPQRRRSVEQQATPPGVGPAAPGPLPPPLPLADLTRIGTVGLAPLENRAGIRAGMERLGGAFYLAITPNASWSPAALQGDLTVSLGVPLRFEVLDSSADGTERFTGLAFRDRDWDSAADLLRLIREVRYGRADSGLHARLSTFHTRSLGHGAILSRYTPNLAVDEHHTSLVLGGSLDPARFEAYVDSLTGPGVIGAWAAARPLASLALPPALRSLELSLTAVADVDAPSANRLDLHDADGDGRRGEIRLGDDGQPEHHVSPIVGYGVGLDARVLDQDEGALVVGAYADLSFLSGAVPKPCQRWEDPAQAVRCPVLFLDDPVNVEDQPTAVELDHRTTVGGALGVLGRLALDDERAHRLSVRLEARLHDPGYVPAYFDNLYAVQRIQYAHSAEATDRNPAGRTKQQQILGRSAGGPVFAVRAEAQYAWRETLAAAVGLILSTPTNDCVLLVHLEAPRLRWFAFHATFQKTASAASDLFSSTRGSVLTLVARAELGPWLYLHLEALTPFGFAAENRFTQLFDVNALLEVSVPF